MTRLIWHREKTGKFSQHPNVFFGLVKKIITGKATLGGKESCFNNKRVIP